MNKLTVLGMGTFGTALSWLLDQVECEVQIWSFESEPVEYFNKHRQNPVFLTDVKFSHRVSAFSDLGEALEGTDAIVSAVPAQFCRQVWQNAGAFGLGEGRPILCASKGIEIKSLQTLDRVFRELFPDGGPFCALSGPTFARELVDGHPSVAVVAGNDLAVAERFQQRLSSPLFRLYTQSDIVGVELAGALKNVIAIAAGVVDGLGYGYNTQAALVTRGLAEIVRLAMAHGAEPTTLLGLAGIGDLMLTCTGPLSRNRTLGSRLGKGEKLSDILASSTQVAEGVDTTRAAKRLAEQLELEVPIIEQTNLLLFHDKDPTTAVRDLMTRSLKNESIQLKL